MLPSSCRGSDVRAGGMVPRVARSRSKVGRASTSGEGVAQVLTTRLRRDHRRRVTARLPARVACRQPRPDAIQAVTVGPLSTPRERFLNR